MSELYRSIRLVGLTLDRLRLSLVPSGIATKRRGGSRALLGARCPVSPKARVWIEESLVWLCGEFGVAALAGEVLLPEPTIAAPTTAGPDVVALVMRLCDRMGAPGSAIDVEVIPSDDIADLHEHLPIESRQSGPAGHYRRNGARFVVAVSERQLRDVVSLTATVAHELAHVRLLGEERIEATQFDQEQLTDLATVFFGLGVFAANAAFESARDERGWKTSHLGYLGERLYGYALAYYSMLRDEARPAWASHLDTNPRAYMAQGLRYLRGRDVGLLGESSRR